MVNALSLHLLRDIFLVVFIAVPTAGAVGALVTLARRRRPVPQQALALAPANGQATTRRGFLTYGAAGVTTLAGASLAGSRLLTEEAGAAGDTCVVNLTINEGYVPMVDGTPVFMRGFGYRDAGGPLVPGPPLAPAGSVGFGELLTLKEGDCLKVVVKNTLNNPHTFAIDNPPEATPLPGKTEVSPGVMQTISLLVILPGETKAIEYVAPRAGTYIYHDVDPVQRLLGLHGTMAVMPKDGTMRPYGNDRPAVGIPPNPLPAPPSFQFQYVWILHDIDPLWGERARLGQPIDVNTFLPRYFTINGGSGGDAPTDSTENKRTHIERELDQATLIRIANCGAAIHACHFHGNHVFVVTDDHGAPFTIPEPDPVTGEPMFDPVTGAPIVRAIALEKDVIRMPALSVKDMLLPCHRPFDQYPPYDPATAFLNDYPMHCHAEMSQTAAGGNYPSGMLTDWSLETNPRRGRRPLN